MRIFLLIILVGLPWCGQAAIYKWVDPETGNVVYSDQPRPGAEPLQLPQAQTYHASPPPQQESAKPASSGQQVDYKDFAIVSPKDKETIRNTAGLVEMSVTVEPKLDVQDGHRISVVMDDKREFGPTANLHFTLKHVVRGTHTLQAMITDRRGQVLAQSAKITIYVKQHSRLHPKPKVPPL